MSKLIHIDQDYKQWIQDLKSRYRRSQIKAAVKINNEVLAYYWDLGRDIVARNAENKYGTGFYANLSQDLRDAIPDTEGLSESSIRYAKRFYELYFQIIKNLPQVVEILEDGNLPQVEEILDNVNRHRIGDGSDAPILPQVVERLLQDIFSIPWGHHRLLIDKCKGQADKALFYVRQTLENSWSRDVLLNVISTDLYERQGKALTNFNRTIPAEDSDLAQEMTRDPYAFGFTGLADKVNETKLKKALLNNITHFLLELGTGFAYVGREYRLQIAEKEKFIDLLFYNLKLSCYVVVEVKIGEFDFADVGQLGGYVVACNHLLRKEGRDNPTIGLLICKEKNNTLAQYALESSSQPLGISEYELQKLYPTKVEGTIPTIAEIESVAQDTVVQPEENEENDK
jgi:predicted nuclease of restriction endonuclease-like (RecB) superfamily